MSTAYIVLLKRDRVITDTVIGPFPTAMDMDAWIAEHEDDLDDWRAWHMDISGSRPHIVLVEELAATRPARWLAEWKEVIQV